jgi:hypothetical protein
MRVKDLRFMVNSHVKEIAFNLDPNMGQIAFLGQVATHTKRILQQLEAHVLNVALVQVDGFEVLCCIALVLD